MKRLIYFLGLGLFAWALAGVIPAPSLSRSPFRPLDGLARLINPLTPLVEAQKGGTNSSVANSLYNGLVAYWDLDETSGSRAAAFQAGSLTLTDPATAGSAAGKLGNAVDLVDSSSQYLSVSDNASLSMCNCDFTLACWVFFDALSSARFVLEKGNANAASTDEYALYFASGPQRMSMRISDGTTRTAANDTTVLSTGTWYFVLGYYDSTNNLIGVQVNNNTATTVSQSNGAQDSTGTFYIGQAGNGASFLDGRVDMVMIWKRLLTSDEKTYLYNSGNGRAPL